LLLILTDQFDTHADRVISELDNLKTPYYRFNLDVESLKKSYITFKNGVWSIFNGESSVSNNLVSCVWLRRPFVEMTLEEYNVDDHNFKIWKNEWNKTLSGLFLDLKNIIWMNDIRKTFPAENKYLQMQVAEKIDLPYPKTIVSNNKEEILAFSANFAKVVLKLMSQEFYKTGENEYKGIYVNVVGEDDFKDFKEASENPIVIQEYIEKDYEVRYVVVGEKHYVCKIESQKSEVANVDWRRYDIPNTPHIVIDPPAAVREKVCLLMNALDITYGALDFIVTKNDEWIFLEVNSMGQWLWIEDLTGLEISKGIAEWLDENMKKERGN